MPEPFHFRAFGINETGCVQAVEGSGFNHAITLRMGRIYCSAELTEKLLGPCSSVFRFEKPAFLCARLYSTHPISGRAAVQLEGGFEFNSKEANYTTLWLPK